MADDVDELPEDLEDEELDAEPVEDLDADLDEDDLEVALDDDDIVDDDIAVEVDVVDDEDVEEPIEEPRAKVTDDEEDDDDDLVDPDDVEADLDTILKDRIAAVEEEEDDEETEPTDAEDRAGETGKIAPRRPGEFVCQSCFLVKSPVQLANAKSQLCVDCV
jgi:hypothetical protein